MRDCFGTERTFLNGPIRPLGAFPGAGLHTVGPIDDGLSDGAIPVAVGVSFRGRATSLRQVTIERGFKCQAATFKCPLGSLGVCPRDGHLTTDPFEDGLSDGANPDALALAVEVGRPSEVSGIHQKQRISTVFQVGH